MSQYSYHQFCPVAMAAEILCTRWTMLIVRELTCGPARFNELRRGMPRISPALLSQRLTELQEAALVTHDPASGLYRLTEAGAELEPIVIGFGNWGQRWVPSEQSLAKLDAPLLMWDMRRRLHFDPPPFRRAVIQFSFPDAPKNDRNWWVMVEPRAPVDICSVDPGHDVDLYVHADLRTMTRVWMGHESVAAARDDDRLLLTGDRELAAGIQRWLGLSGYAGVERKVA